MNIALELLARYTAYLATAPGWSVNGYSQRMQVCMTLERVAASMMDEATPDKRNEIFVVYNSLICQTLDGGRPRTSDA